MIHLIGKYYMEVDERNYTVVKEKEKPDKNGNKTYGHVGHCSSCLDAMRLLQRRVVADKLKDSDMELSEALMIIREQTKIVADAMRGIDI